MQRLALTLLLLCAVLCLPPSAGAGEKSTTTKKLGNYVVRKPNSSDCRIEAKKVPKDSVMVGDAPYASEAYAKAALEKFPECKSEAKSKGEQ
jgi:hypothetical protein